MLPTVLVMASDRPAAPLAGTLTDISARSGRKSTTVMAADARALLLSFLSATALASSTTASTWYVPGSTAGGSGNTVIAVLVPLTGSAAMVREMPVLEAEPLPTSVQRPTRASQPRTKIDELVPPPPAHAAIGPLRPGAS